ncbi:putative transcription factor & chromatin remodeling ARID family [Helianthus annuus]|nr:putative transcription factor & chromatin remodeling ARID family [Helianthus annuus]
MYLTIVAGNMFGIKTVSVTLKLSTFFLSSFWYILHHYMFCIYTRNMSASLVNTSAASASSYARDRNDPGFQQKEIQNVLNLNNVNEKYKHDYLNSYFETLNVSNEHEFDWSLMIIRALEFNEFADCKALLDMIDDRDFVFKYKHDLEMKFEIMVDWFLNEKMGITTRSIPPLLDDGRKIDLLSLYIMVERDGGYQSVTVDNLWPAIAKDLGFEYQDGDFIRVIYAMYLDVLVYYYKFKSVQKKVQDKAMVEQEGSSMAGNEQARKCKSADADPMLEEGTTEHYALYAGNSWEGSWNLHKKRCRFNFSEARKAVDEANRSVMMKMKP